MQALDLPPQPAISRDIQTDHDVSPQHRAPTGKRRAMDGAASYCHTHYTHLPANEICCGLQNWNDPITSKQFHVLFNSLFKVLFIFPSRYLFAIGLALIFSFRWNLPPTLRCIPKQRDSQNTCLTRRLNRYEREYHPPCCPFPRDLPQTTALTTRL